MDIKRAIISVTDKTGIIDFARGLASYSIEIVSTGGTAKHLTEAGIPCTLVEKVTGFPEMMGGRLKTLHPKIFGGILAGSEEHIKEALAHSIELFDLVVVNLYDFANEPSIEQIDIGGPSMIRAAAKNGARVTVVVEPKDYPRVLEEISSTRGVGRWLRQDLVCTAFAVTALYDGMIAGWIADQRAAGNDFLNAISSH